MVTADQAEFAGAKPSRRTLIKAMGVTAAAGGMTLAGVTPASATTNSRGSDASRYRTRLVLLGTSGGPVLINPNRTGTSTAIVYDKNVYIVDLGFSAMLRLKQAQLGPAEVATGAATNVRGVFITHLHSDHIADWPMLYSTGAFNTTGRPASPIEVFGPGNRGTLPRLFPPNRPEPTLINPSNPTPGITETTDYLRQAYANDFNDRARDSAFTADALFKMHDIDLSGVWAVDSEGVPPRLTAPLQIWQDGDVKITATLVDHHPTAPAFAYRFDTPDGSIVVSGDTTVSQNLIDLAHNADYLVHEVIDPQFVDLYVATLPPEQQAPLREHLLASHTTIERVGRDVAQPAGVKNLVLSHQVPGNNSNRRWRLAQKGYSGNLIIGDDLDQFGVGKRRR